MVHDRRSRIPAIRRLYIEKQPIQGYRCKAWKNPIGIETYGRRLFQVRSVTLQGLKKPDRDWNSCDVDDKIEMQELQGLKKPDRDWNIFFGV